MESLFTPTVNLEMVDRIDKLTADTKPLWGKMKVAQMLAHSQTPLHVALGEKKIKGGLMAFLFGRIAKKQLEKMNPLKKTYQLLPALL